LAADVSALGLPSFLAAESLSDPESFSESVLDPELDPESEPESDGGDVFFA
jgi:hypothetical protein